MRSSQSRSYGQLADIWSNVTTVAIVVIFFGWVGYPTLCLGTYYIVYKVYKVEYRITVSVIFDRVMMINILIDPTLYSLY